MILQVEQQQVFQGPIPHPAILEGYAQIDSTLPDRIIKMAEQDLKTRHRMNYLGWFGTYSLSLTLILGGIYLVAKDKSIAGLITLACSAVLPILQLSFQRKNKTN